MSNWRDNIFYTFAAATSAKSALAQKETVARLSMNKFMCHLWGGATIMVELANGDAFNAHVWADPVRYQRFFPDEGEVLDRLKQSNNDLAVYREYRRKSKQAQRQADAAPRQELNYSIYFTTRHDMKVTLGVQSRESLLNHMSHGVSFHLCYLPGPWE